MGLAGAGKGTQANLLVERQGYALISTGDLLRQYATDEQKQRMQAGILLEDQEIFGMISQALDKVPDLSRCLIDGTPRSIPQADWLLQEADQRQAALEAVIHLDIPEAVVRQRLLARGRLDDTEAAITKRFQEYHRSTEPLLQHLAAKGVPIRRINGDQPAENVYSDIVQSLEKVKG
jgi:adenylate kinase